MRVNQYHCTAKTLLYNLITDLISQISKRGPHPQATMLENSRKSSYNFQRYINIRLKMSRKWWNLKRSQKHISQIEKSLIKFSISLTQEKGSLNLSTWIHFLTLITNRKLIKVKSNIPQSLFPKREIRLDINTMPRSIRIKTRNFLLFPSSLVRKILHLHLSHCLSLLLLVPQQIISQMSPKTKYLTSGWNKLN